MNYAAVEVDAVDSGLDEARRAQVRADRQGAVPGVERPGANLKQQGSQDDEVVPADEDDLDVRPVAAQPLQVTGGRNPAEAAAEDDDPGLPRFSVNRIVQRE